MKTFVSYLIVILLTGLFVFYVTEDKKEVIEKVLIKKDTVSVTYTDTVYVFKTKYKYRTVRDTVFTTLTDTMYVRNTLFVSYYSPFKIGSDSVNATGIVSFDMRNFTFSNVRFHYPSLTKTVYVKQTDTWDRVKDFGVGVLVGGLITSLISR